MAINIKCHGRIKLNATLDRAQQIKETTTPDKIIPRDCDNVATEMAISAATLAVHPDISFFSKRYAFPAKAINANVAK